MMEAITIKDVTLLTAHITSLEPTRSASVCSLGHSLILQLTNIYRLTETPPLAETMLESQHVGPHVSAQQS